MENTNKLITNCWVSIQLLAAETFVRAEYTTTRAVVTSWEKPKKYRYIVVFRQNPGIYKPLTRYSNSRCRHSSEQKIQQISRVPLWVKKTPKHIDILCSKQNPGIYKPLTQCPNSCCRDIHHAGINNMILEPWLHHHRRKYACTEVKDQTNCLDCHSMIQAC